MARPVMGRRERVRVEFSLSPALADQVYRYAKIENLTLSQAGERLLADALARSTHPMAPGLEARTRIKGH